MAVPITNKPNSFPLFLKIALSILISLLLIVVGAVGFWFFQKNYELKKKTSASPTPTPAAASLTTSQSEESLAPLVSPEPVPQASPAPAKSDLELLREAFAAKYSHPVAEAEVTISKQTGPYVSGGIHFTGQTGGGWFLAYKQADGTWVIVADGNGTVPCEAIEPYNFPVDLVPECWDDSTSTLIYR